MYDLARDEERRVTVQLNTQRRASVSGRHIVWSDFRNADPATGVSFDIYMATIDDFPSAPTGLVAAPGAAGGIELSWNGNVEAEGDLTGYGIYRATTPGGPYERIATSVSSTFTDGSVNGGITYHYRVTALDGGISNLDLQQGEGPYSNEACATADAPLPPPRSTSGSPRRDSKRLEPTAGAGSGPGGN
jgi:hypothetical protein